MKTKAFIKYTKKGKIIPGSLITTPGNHPDKSSIWREVPVDLCCESTTGKLTALTGPYYLAASYSPATSEGLMTFPDHLSATGSLNPNEIGQIGGSTRTQIYINTYNDNGGDETAKLTNLVNKGGKLILVQSGNYVVLTFTSKSFENTAYADNVYADNAYENSLPGSITVEIPSASNFNTSDVINIFIINN